MKVLSDACINMPHWTRCACNTRYGDMQYHLGMHNIDNQQKIEQ